MERRSNRREMLVQSLPRISAALPQQQLSGVKSCAMLGCGRGHNELAFVGGCLPNVAKLTAVEPDADQIAALETRVVQLLPNVSTEFCQETAQSWQGADEPFDAVLLFHCLYFVPPSERPALLEKLFDNVAPNGGLVFVLTSPCDRENPPAMNRLFDRLSIPSYNLFDVVDGVQVCDMMTSVGFRRCCQLPVEHEIDVAEPNDDVMEVLSFLSGWKLGVTEVREAAREVIGSATAVQQDMWFGVFEKP